MDYLKLAKQLNADDFSGLPEFAALVRATDCKHLNDIWRIKNRRLFFTERWYLGRLWEQIENKLIGGYVTFRCTWDMIGTPNASGFGGVTGWEGTVQCNLIFDSKPITFAAFKSIGDCTTMTDVAEKVFAYLLSCLANQPIEFDENFEIK